MAHFARLDENNIVQQVITVSNNSVNANGGDYSTEAENYVKTKFGKDFPNDTWKQTSYNNNQRKQYASPGMNYDSENNRFLKPKPEELDSWSLDSNGDWKAPIERPAYDIWPEGTDNVVWKEADQKWVAYIIKTAPIFNEAGTEIVTAGTYKKRDWNPDTSTFNAEEDTDIMETRNPIWPL